MQLHAPVLLVVLFLESWCMAQGLGLLGGLGSSLLSPVTTSLTNLLSGYGLVQSSLGAIGGMLGNQQQFDYIVAGGGTAGNAIGVRLAEAGFSVAIVEAGGFYEISKPVLSTTPAGDIIGVGGNMGDSIATVDWVFQTEPQAGANNRQFHYARGKCIGGSSALNFMLYHRGTTGTYDRWADLVGDDSYRLTNLQPYFMKSVSFTPPNQDKRLANASTQYNAQDFASGSNGGPVQVSYTNWVSVWATWLEQGLMSVGLKRTTGFNDGQLLGFHYSQTTIDSDTATRSSSAEYINRAKNKGMSNLKVFTNTQVTKILFDKNKNATGVTVTSLGITYTMKAAKEVIVSAGAFQSPQLLMVSGIGPVATLTKFKIPILSALEGVGQNMWDHIFFGPTYRVSFPTLNAVLGNTVEMAKSLTQYIASQDGPLSSNIIEFLGWEKLPAQYRTNFSPDTSAALASFPDDWPEVEYMGANAFAGDLNWPLNQQPKDGFQYATILGAMVAPLSRGNVTIRSASALDKPVINPNWLTAKADQEAAVAWYRRMRDVWQTSALQGVAVGSEYWPGPGNTTDAQLLATIRNTLMTVWHASCTCKMGQSSDKMAVVDNRARVFGVQRLRVVDASAFPLLPPGHPQSTVYALAEKIADDIVNNRS